MWMIFLGFGLATLLLAWLLFGYVVWLRFVGDLRGRSEAKPPTSFPTVSIVVPCFNEEDFVAEKYRNLTSCEYPAEKVEIVFADGGSTDDTTKILVSLASGDSRTRVVTSPKNGKINQLNHVLPGLNGEIIVVTDADARLARDALMWMVGEFQAKPQVMVVGAYTSPRGGLAVERCYWAAQNRIRLLESRVSHVSMVIACCYAFRRSLVAGFPDDVIADDVYVAVLANTLGYKTKYSARALVEELRTPGSLPEFFRHKFRKSNAVLREMLRFSYRLPDVDSRWKSILSTRIIQQLFLPWGTALWVGLAATLVNLGQFDVACLGAGVLLAALLATRKATMCVELPGEPERFNLRTVILAYGYTMAVLFATSLTYLSFRQGSDYARLQGRSRSMDRTKVEAKARRPGDKPAPMPSLQGVPVTLSGTK